MKKAPFDHQIVEGECADLAGPVGIFILVVVERSKPQLALCDDFRRNLDGFIGIQSLQVPGAIEPQNRQGSVQDNVPEATVLF
jgi:hypothetical protein